MSLIVEISTYNGIVGPNLALRKMADSLNALLGGGNTKDVIENTVCRGILQNDINIGFNNLWGQTAYQGIYGGLEALSNTKVEAATFGASLNVVKAGFDFANTALNMGGVSLVGAGAASTRLYQGSSMTGFTTTMKWYTPKDDSYIDSLKALLILGFPSLRKEQTNSTGSLNNLGKKEDGSNNIFGSFSERIPVVGQLPELITGIYDSLSSFASYNPPTLMVKVVDNLGNPIFQLHPLVISNITITSSRETYYSKKLKKRIPVVISASVSYEFYQVMGNNGYTKDEFIIAGVPVLGKMING